MFIEMNCPCEAMLQMDAEDNDTAVWSLVWRFVNQHSVCGFVTPDASLIQPQQKMVARPTAEVDDE